MVCTQCGCEQAAGGQFCRQCGARVVSAPPPLNAMPQQGPGYYAGMNYATPQQRMRVQQNLQPMGIGWLLFGAYRVMMGLVAGLALHSMSRFGSMFGDVPAFVPHLFAGLVPIIAVTTGFMALLSLLTGYSLLARKPWGRVLAIVMAILSLIKIPIGTGLGIYTLWVLAPGVSGEEWQRIQQPAV